MIFISTPERDLCHGVGNLGPPTNPCHVQEWNLFEFQMLLKYYGLNPLMGLIGNEGKLNCMYALI